ncbi:MAG: Holliday junction resolvase RuvX [Deltaproteobacteria bacterium]|jgi:putative Holliday junction resolvase|nr:Holliday junction resolvase RuvX [Deltaproteobacteria bacterium]
MPRFLALDPGSVTVGVAVSDESGSIARPLAALPRRPHAAFLAALGSLMEEYRPEALVMGLPLLQDGGKGKEAQRALSLAHQLRTRLGAKVLTVDESLSSVEAQGLLSGPLSKRASEPGARDKLAAALILERFLKSPASREPSP